MTTPERDIRKFRMISVAPTVVEPRNRRLVFDPATFQGVRPGAPVLADHINASGRVAGRVLTAWVDRNAGAVLGTVEIYPDNIEAAAHVRRLLHVAIAARASAMMATWSPVPTGSARTWFVIGASQKELYAPAGLGELALDVAMNKITSADDLRSKLESIHINPKPIAAGISDAEVSQYNLQAVPA